MKYLNQEVSTFTETACIVGNVGSVFFKRLPMLLGVTRPASGHEIAKTMTATPHLRNKMVNACTPNWFLTVLSYFNTAIKTMVVVSLKH